MILQTTLSIERDILAYFGKYKVPSDLMSDENLSIDEKITMLKQWRLDEKALIRATGEGMEGEDRPDILKQIKKSLFSLQNPAEKR